MMVKVGSTTLRAIDEAIDCLVTDGRAALSVQSQPTSDLLWRPAVLELVDDVPPQDFVPVQLAQPLLPLLTKVVAADFAVNGGAVAAELLGNLRHRHLGVQQAEDRAALVESELPVGSR